MECVDRKMTEPVKFRDNQPQGLWWSQVRTILALFHVWRLEVEQEKGKSLSARISQFQNKVPGLGVAILIVLRVPTDPLEDHRYSMGFT